jgi:hypothetical protein
VKFLLGIDWMKDLGNVRIVSNMADPCHLIHILAEKFASLRNMTFYMCPEDIEDSLDLFSELIRGIEDIHTLQWNGYAHDLVFLTPLTRLVHAMCSQWTFGSGTNRESEFYKHVKVNLRGWLRTLHKAGIDLESYGEKEIQLLHSHQAPMGSGGVESIQDGIRDCKTSFYTSLGLEFHLIGFKIGPNVEDWDVLLSEPVDEMVGDFWKMIIDPPFYIPGSWVDMV